jgi:hypothetical protein
MMQCRIRVKGHLSNNWADWFGDMTLENQPGGEALISGLLPDQGALYGVLNRIRDMGLELLSMDCSQQDADTAASLFEIRQ